MGPPSVRPWRTPAVTSAVSRSIFIRPPRPWPSWRRAMSRLTASGSSSSPAGSPSTIVERPGPWLSPAVMTRSDTGGSLLRPPRGTLRRRLGARREGGPGADDARLGLRGRRPGAPVHLEEVELVLRHDGALLVGDVDELRLPGAQPDPLAGVHVRPALAVADGLDAVVEQELGRLAVLEEAQVDEHGLPRGRQRLEALERLASRAGRRVAEADGDVVLAVRLLGRRGRL